MAADHVQTFFALAGDLNRDRAVNGTDFAVLAGNFGKTGMTYAQGDLTGDGNVNGSDFALLAGNFGKSLAAARAVVATQSVATRAATVPAAGAEPTPPAAIPAAVKRRPAPARRTRPTTPLPRRTAAR
jgi:Dockerin type I domain